MAASWSVGGWQRPSVTVRRRLLHCRALRTCIPSPACRVGLGWCRSSTRRSKASPPPNLPLQAGGGAKLRIASLYSCAPSPACRGGLGWGRSSTRRSKASPPPNHPLQAGGGANSVATRESRKFGLFLLVIPAEAGTQCSCSWGRWVTRFARPYGAALRAFCALFACPAFAGMTSREQVIRGSLG